MSTILKAVFVGISVPCLLSGGAILTLVTPSASIESPMTAQPEIATVLHQSTPSAASPSTPPIAHTPPSFEIRQTPQERSNEGLSYFQDGNWLSAKGQWLAAREQYQKALTIAQELKQTQLESVILNNLGQTYAATRNYEAALDYYRQALSLSDQRGRSTGSGRILANMGDVHYQQKRYPQALNLYAQALQFTSTDPEATHLIHQHIQATKIAMMPKATPKPSAVASRSPTIPAANPAAKTVKASSVASSVNIPKKEHPLD